jgi:DNA-binding winged helix-turn-helix (wHTH) protein
MADCAYHFGEFSIWPSERRLVRGGKSILLPPKAFDALLLFVRSHGSLVLRANITRVLWPDTHVSEANLTNIIVLLRKALGQDSIQTVSKSGYRFTLPVLGESDANQAVYASFVRGKEYLGERSLEFIGRARDHFLFCVAEDPQFATGWAWLARSCRLLEKFKGETSPVFSPAEAAFRRAFLIDPDLACGHQFYTQLQVDSGHALQAMTRLAARIKRFGEDPETLAGLVQVLRCCGQLEKSVAAHHAATALDFTTRTSVAHTHFLLGDYPSLLEAYVGRGYYLDAAAWAALGQRDRAVGLLRTRIEWPDLGPSMLALIGSLLAVLEDKRGEALTMIERADIGQEPEGQFYLARHCGLVSDAPSAIKRIRLARLAGFCSSHALEHDAAFATMRTHPQFILELVEARRLEANALSVFEQELGSLFLRPSKL